MTVETATTKLSDGLCKSCQTLMMGINDKQCKQDSLKLQRLKNKMVRLLIWDEKIVQWVSVAVVDLPFKKQTKKQQQNIPVFASLPTAFTQLILGNRFTLTWTKSKCIILPYDTGIEPHGPHCLDFVEGSVEATGLVFASHPKGVFSSETEDESHVLITWRRY